MGQSGSAPLGRQPRIGFAPTPENGTVQLRWIWKTRWGGQRVWGFVVRRDFRV